MQDLADEADDKLTELEGKEYSIQVKVDTIPGNLLESDATR